MTFFRSLCAATMSVALLGTPAKADVKNITIGTNPSGSTFYLIGSSFAKTLQEETGIRSTAQPFSGSSVYLPSIALGDIVMGMSTTVDAGMAYRGEGGYPQALTSLRTLARVWIIPYAFIARADSGIVSANDLKGKRVMGQVPSAQELTFINESIVRSGGIALEDVRFMTSGGLMDGINAVVEGRADAAPVATTMPVLIEANASTPGGLRIIANGTLGDAAFFANEVPGVSTATAAEDPNKPFIMGDTPIVAYDALLIADESLSEDDAYRITKTIHDNWADLQAAVGPLRSLSQSDLAMATTTVPYHAGAIRLYKELGLWTSEHAANQSKF
ncbi:TAXI family TRAP transporter solute-binding subunit [Celeribacter sp. ULVN23_4]